MAELKTYMDSRQIKNTLNTKANDLTTKKRKALLLDNLITYCNYRQQKKFKSDSIRETYKQKFMVKMFN
jgi:hypothetical protein